MKLVRASTTHPDFQALIGKLDAELRSRYGVQQSAYEQHNTVDQIETAIVGYVDERPVACGCFKTSDSETAELKRMYVDREHRGRGYAVEVVKSLESWAAELGFGTMRLETGKGQPEAIALYRKCGYLPMENYEPYVGVENSVCMVKQLAGKGSRPTSCPAEMDTESARKFLARDRYAALTGVEIVEAGKGYCRTRLVIEDRHLNGANVVQGGAIFTLADLAFAVAANSHGQLALAINANISFLRGKSTGILYATATEVAAPTRLGAYDVLVTDEEGEVVARFNGMVYRKKEPLPE